MPHRPTACVVASILLAPVATGQMFMELGDLPGGDVFTRPNDISADGSVIVGVSESSLGSEAFRWTLDTGIVGLGDLPGGFESSSANGVSADGTIIVGTGASFVSSGELVTWNGTAGPTSLGFLPGGGGSLGNNISANGLVIVGEGSNNQGRPEAFRWTAATGLVGLGALPGGIGSNDPFNSRANDVSADGSVIVGQGFSSRGFEAVRWTAATGVEDLGTFADGSIAIEATAITPDGSVIVGRGAIPGGSQAFRWTAATGLVGIGDLPGAALQSRAFDVTADGSMIVGSGFAPVVQTTGFVWTEAEGIRSIESFLTNEIGLDIGDLRLGAVRAVSDDGNVLTGVARNTQNRSVGWVAVLTADECPADANGAGELTPADFNAWVIAFNTSADACDQNGDGLCDPADFNAWVLNFNAGC